MQSRLTIGNLDCTFLGMWKAFHHPDISLPVVRRRIGLELVEALEVLGDAAVHGAWAFLKNRSYPDRRAYNRALGRLEKQGLVVRSRGLDTPFLGISPQGEGVLEDYFRAERWWGRKWNGIWNLLVYDVPEADRSYRNVFRAFLKKMRLGCFQKSVWITPYDIRPQYDDLMTAASLRPFACLFEAKTVLGMQAEAVVCAAWDFDSLFEIQNRFCKVYGANLELLQTSVVPGLEELMRLAAEEVDAFRHAFVLDPLLPQALLPYDYRGMEAFRIHREITGKIRESVLEANPI